MQHSTMTTLGIAARVAPRCGSRFRYLSTLSTGVPLHAKRVVSASVDSLDDDGDALATTDATSRLLRVPFAVPGDALEVEIWHKDAANTRQRDAMFAQLVKIVEPSRHRVDAPCAKYFGVCGGCKHQNVAYDEQLEQKQRRVESLFQSLDMREPVRRILGVDVAAGGLFEYRNKMEFTCSTGRWMLESEMAESENEDGRPVMPSFTLGMFPVSSVGTRRARLMKKRGRVQWNARILSIDGCSLQDKACDELLNRIQSLCEEFAIEAYDFHSHEGFLKNVILRRGIVDGRREIMVGFVTTTLGGGQQDVLEQLVAKLIAERTDSELVSVIQRQDEEALRHRVQRGELSDVGASKLEMERVLFGNDHFHDSILDHKFQVSFDSFFQPNSTQASTLYSVIRVELALSTRKPVVWDLFCGVGSIGICMGAHVDKLVGIELVEAAVHKARYNAQINGYSDKMEFHHLDLSNHWNEVTAQLQQLMADKSTRPDIIIVDPPRGGLHKKLVALLRGLAPSRICYVSCNPQTQARDFALLTAEEEGDAAFAIDYLQPIDMLPHTPHIETVAWLSRR